ncbi:MAG TPA: prolyl oligopeptidase family serine peptidase [Bacteroidales bacterium]|nr:prolyl oligopeptidase family serine peptidase [Bacteroidales bacterium]
MKHLIALLLMASFAHASMAQPCRSFTLKDYDRWHDVSATKIKDNGSLISWEWNPQKGDGKLIVYQTLTQKYDTIHRAYDAAFFADAHGVVAKVKPYRDLIRKQTLDGVKKDKLTKDSLVIRLYEPDTTIIREGLRTFKVPQKSGRLMAWMFEENYGPKADTAVADTAKKAAKKPARLKQAGKVYTLGVFDAKTLETQYFHHVSDYVFSAEGVLSFVTQNAKGDSSFIWLLSENRTSPERIAAHAGWVSAVSGDPRGMQWAYLHTCDTSSRKIYSLWYFDARNQRHAMLADSAHKAIPEGLTISGDYDPRFSDDGTAIYFGLGRKPAPLAKDTLTAEEKVSLDIWHWKDGQLQSQQLKNLEREQKRSWLAVYYPARNQLISLGADQQLDMSPRLKNHIPVLTATSARPYEILSSWEQTRYVDVWLVNRLSGERRLLLQKHNGFFQLSPDGSHLIYYNESDSAWYGMELKRMQKVRLTRSEDIFYDDQNDIPRPASSAGFVGWRDHATAVVNSAGKLWLLDLSGKKAPATFHTPENTVVRAVITDREEPTLPPVLPLTVYYKSTKQMAMGRLDLKNLNATFNMPEPLHYSRFVKAKNAETYLFTAENYSTYPELQLTTDLMQQGIALTHANPWKDEYCRGTVELMSWRSLNGEQLEGLLYFPANYNPQERYPMIVYFYEQHSDNLHRYLMPRPSRSTVNIPEYTSRGYFVFTPDIRYRDGLPGQSAYDAVLSGVQSLLERYPSINPQRLGIQGQSWGGYQTAWLVTQTNIFRAAMAGAPVSNMTSAYGGIRWESGVVRQFQYEEGQSRIGTSLWENLPLYIENSPIFYADRVTTPLLIMANDNDGAVPWTQGIELFTALRRLGKPVWMLNYNNGPHNLTRRADTEDFTIRLQEFFDHYLKDAPMPAWMEVGVPALQKKK